MRPIILSVLLAALPGAGESKVDSTFLLSKGRAGAVVVWSSISQPYARYKTLYRPPLAELTDLSLEGMFTPAFKLYMEKDQDRDKPSLIAEVGSTSRHSYVITGIIVYDERFKTSRGIGVGSTLDELRDKHTVGSLTPGSDHVGLRAPVPDLNMHFSLQADDWPLYEHGQKKGESMIPGDTKIWRIFIR